jgi:uncharacterized membrane protein
MSNYTFIYRTIILVILAVLVGGILKALSIGVLSITISGDIATVILALVEGIVAVVLLLQTRTEASSFLLDKLRTTI